MRRVILVKAMSEERHDISRYRTSQGIEGEFEPGSRGRVLRNKLGIRSKRQMDQAEGLALLKAQERYLHLVTSETTFTADVICRMHRDWLGRIYEWAGRYKSVELSKGSFRWPPARLVAQNMEAVERETLHRLTPCRGGTVAAVARAMAEVQAELLMVHPYREGNGRLARWVSDLMAMQAGLPAVDYGFRGKGSRLRRREYLQAVVSGYVKDYEPLTRFLAEAIERALRERGER